MPLTLPLKSGDLALLREKLRARARVLRAEVSSALHSPEGAFAIPSHLRETDDATADLETDLEVASVERDAAELEAIEHALARLETPAFGTCTDCNATIGRSRLFAEPTATRCLACEKRFEPSGRRPSAFL
jgi:DnaK suppressor protein